MRTLKLMIIILLVFIIGIVGLMFIINFRKQSSNNVVNVSTSNNFIKNEQINVEENVERIEDENAEGTELEYAPELSFNTEIQEVTSNSELYSISQSITKYYNYIKDNNEIAINESGEITANGIVNNIKYIAKNAFVTSNEYQSKYYIQGDLIEFTENSIVSEHELYVIMHLDLDNNTYKISESTINEFENMKELTDEEDIEILNEVYNNYEYTYIDGVSQLEIYLEDYAFYLVNDINKAYNMLEEEYKVKRFDDINEFNEFISKNLSRLQNVEITQYNLIKDDETTTYIGKDEQGNYYRIIEKAYMDYSVILDTYTIIEDYDELDNNDKIKLNTERFILMLNAKDYSNAYEALEPTFKETYFKTEQEFIDYVQQNFFERNIIASKELTEEGICVVDIRETISTRSNKIQKSFKVTLLENNFYIIFSM